MGGHSWLRVQRALQISTFSSIVGFANRILARFLFLLVEKNGRCIGVLLFGGWCFGTGRVITDEFCLALIRL